MLTAELNRLRDQFVRLHNVVAPLGLHLVDDPSWTEPSGFHYLTEKARTDPHIMANVEAMCATNVLSLGSARTTRVPSACGASRPIRRR